MKEKNESTLLHFAAFKNELPKMKIYILHFEAFSKENHKRNRNEATFESQLKAWINVQNSDGLTALHFATLHGNLDMIEFLERYGANMQVQSNDQENILFMCAENNHLKAAVYLLDHRDGKVQFDVNAPNHLGDTPLHKVAKHGFANFAAYLLARPDTDRDATNAEGWTPLMYAVSGSWPTRRSRGPSTWRAPWRSTTSSRSSTTSTATATGLRSPAT
jgi:ankyrin repeat protein